MLFTLIPFLSFFLSFFPFLFLRYEICVRRSIETTCHTHADHSPT
jgi:hypothetical protein